LLLDLFLLLLLGLELLKHTAWVATAQQRKHQYQQKAAASTTDRQPSARHSTSVFYVVAFAPASKHLDNPRLV
jgi:hypothetical protein